LSGWRSIEIRHREHIRYTKTNNPISAYALRIPNNRHEYGSQKHTLQLLKAWGKESKGDEVLEVILHEGTTTTEFIDR
jgi:hypothetical protein